MRVTGKNDPRTDVMIQAARTLAFGGAVPENIKQPWKTYVRNEFKFAYVSHTVNVVVERRSIITRECRI